MNIKEAQKISIIGCSGSGKSTLAIKLGKFLNLPVHHIDCYFLKPNGVWQDKEVLRRQIKTISTGDKWILDGNFRNTLEDRFKQSDLIIFLNFPINFCIQSVKNRRAQGQKIGLPDHFIESDEAFEILLSFIDRYPEHKENYYLPLVRQYSNKVIEFNDRQQVDEFVKKVKPPNK